MQYINLWNFFKIAKTTYNKNIDKAYDAWFVMVDEI
jgi:hypothetical protein